MTNRPSLPLTGGCSCSAIRYEIRSFPLLLYTCNCSNCQRASGSAFALNMPVAAKSLQVLKGEPRGWRHISPSGVPVVSWFCGECGTRIYGERSERPDIMNIRAGTLDATDWLVPVAHMFLKSAQSWLRPPSDSECYEVGPEDFRPLAKKWQQMWPEFFPAI